MKNASIICDITAIARQRYAEELFDTDRIATVIEGRASEGYRELRVRQDHPFDLTGSPSARRLEAWLETNNFLYAWHPARPIADRRHRLPRETYPELVICW